MIAMSVLDRIPVSRGGHLGRRGGKPGVSAQGVQAPSHRFSNQYH